MKSGVVIAKDLSPSLDAPAARIRDYFCTYTVSIYVQAQKVIFGSNGSSDLVFSDVAFSIIDLVKTAALIVLSVACCCWC